MEEKTEINKAGATVLRDFYCNRERYHYDLNLGAGWKQYDTDQDFRCFGVWVNIKEMKTLSFVEGDEIITVSPTPEVFRAELQSMADFYGPPPPAFSYITEGGSLHEVHADRPHLDDAGNK